MNLRFFFSSSLLIRIGLMSLTILRASPPVQTHLKVLESEDVQDADGLEVFSAPDARVELADDPVETLRIKCHRH